MRYVRYVTRNYFVQRAVVEKFYKTKFIQKLLVGALRQITKLPVPNLI
jgi:hypothetical protein